MKTRGTKNCECIACIDKYKNIWRIRCDIVEDDEGSTYEEFEFNHKPSLAEIKETLLSFYNSKIDDKIQSGFVWKDMPVWLSKENQFNYKVAFDLAIVPVKFKFGTTVEPVYYEFTTLQELNDFYTKAISYINSTLEEGWKEKDAIDFSLYNI